MRKLRGKEIGFIFQDPLTSLNPTLTIGYQIARGDPRAHGPARRRRPRDRVVELLAKVGIPRPADRLKRLPAPVLGRHAPARDDRHRAVVRPEADPRRRADDRARRDDPGADPRADPDACRTSSGTAVLLITHDLGIAAGMCDRVNVMYAGRIVETGTVDELFESPQMPYTWGLLDSLPRIDDVRGDRLRTIEGLPPLLIDAARRLPVRAALPLRPGHLPRRTSRS